MHLVVVVHRWDLSRDPHDTPPPNLPESIDRLLVLHCWAQQRGAPNLWWADSRQNEHNALDATIQATSLGLLESTLKRRRYRILEAKKGDFGQQKSA